MHIIKLIIEIFWRFLILGCIGFGGPAAHIALFQVTFTQKLRWLTPEEFAQLLALTQFLPGPGSSQMGFAIGMRRAGLLGGISAFIAFTLPSFLLLLLLVFTGIGNSENPHVDAVIHGLKLLALVVVLDAVMTMYKNFCHSKTTSSIAVAAALVLLVYPSAWTQILVILVAGGIAYLRIPSEQSDRTTSSSINPSWLPLGVFLLLLVVLPSVMEETPIIAIFNQFFAAGSLVFGGGHVVLPLLQETVATALTPDQFLTGYAAAQAIPGPMFTLSTYLGAELLPTTPIFGAAVATIAIFLPGFLLVMALAPAWQNLSQNMVAKKVAMGINAAVVGLLIAALYQPVFVSAVSDAKDIAAAILGFSLLRIYKIPLLALVVLMAGLGWLLQML